MIRLHFEGFFQCRLATDSAAYDAPRGVGGWTFAFSSEPDLDRIIRLENPVALRSHSPGIGVNIVNATTDTQLDVSLLLGSKVAFLNDAVFEGRNGSIAGDAVEPISPIELSVTNEGVRLERGSAYDVENPIERSPFMGRGIISLPDAEVRGVKISNANEAAAYREARKHELQAALSNESDPDQRDILEQRLIQLEAPAGGAIIGTLFSAVPYSFQLLDEPTVEFPIGSALAEKIDLITPWEMEFWMGCWDADTLTGYMRGNLTIPTRD